MASISYSTHFPHIRGYKQMVLLILSPDARYITVSSNIHRAGRMRDHAGRRHGVCIFRLMAYRRDPNN